MTCKYCLAAWGEIDSPVCAPDGHESPATVALAQEMVSVFRGVRPPQDEHVGWFIEDAASVVAQLGAQDKWVVLDAGVEKRHHDGPCQLVSVNGTVFISYEGAGLSVYDASRYADV